MTAKNRFIRAFETVTSIHQDEIMIRFRAMKQSILTSEREMSDMVDLLNRIESYKGSKRLLYLVVTQLYCASLRNIMDAALSGTLSQKQTFCLKKRRLQHS